MNAQEKLLMQILGKYRISPEIVEAFKKNPRHLFIKRPYLMEEMYGDYPLEIYQDEEFVSTISQPSFVLLMLQMLKVERGQKVLELGAGSGWNAALLGSLVGEEGKVVSLEIIPSLAEETKENLKNLDIRNVVIIHGDGAFGYPDEAPFARGVFTAGATDLPKAFHEQIKVGGLLLFVLKTSFVDLLLLLEKKQDHFEEIERLSCSFVPMKGEKKALPEGDLDYLVQSSAKIKIRPSQNKEGKDSVFSGT